jgi:hypothetical protein
VVWGGWARFGRGTPCWVVMLIMNLDEGVRNTKIVVVVATLRYTLLLGIKVGKLPIRSISEFHSPYASCCLHSIQNTQHEALLYSLPALQQSIATSLSHVRCGQHHCHRPQRCDWYPISITNINRNIRNNSQSSLVSSTLSSPLT